MEPNSLNSQTGTTHHIQHTDTANGNTTKATNPEPCKEDNNKNEKSVSTSEKTAKLYRKFRGILNKITPTNFDSLLNKVLALEINNQKRMEGVINLIFEKVIKEPMFSTIYANLCLKLSSLRVPSDNNRDNAVSFRGLIISKCQYQFEFEKSDEELMKLEESAETAEPAKKKELQMMIDEGNMKMRLRAVANVRFIGELYKLKMLTSKIMNYCVRYLIDKIEDVELECVCELLTTIGEQIEKEDGTQLDPFFMKMQEIVERKRNKISNRVRFMIQDVIDLRKRNWTPKSHIDSKLNRGGLYYKPSVLRPSDSANKMKETHVSRRRWNKSGGR